MKIRFNHGIELETITKNGKEMIEIINDLSTRDVLVVETNESFGTATIHFRNGRTAYGVPINSFEILS